MEDSTHGPSLPGEVSRLLAHVAELDVYVAAHCGPF